jgi:predicted Zn finger-like uncharacterized protein
MLTKQSCQHCGTHIEFDADQVDGAGVTVSCPKCQASVTLLKPPPALSATPPFIERRKRRCLWILGAVGIFVVALPALILLAVLLRNRPTLGEGAGGLLSPTDAIVPERYFRQKPITEALDRFAFDLGVKEMNKLFYKHGEFVFAHRYISPEKNRYVQGKRVVYQFRPSLLSEADVMNGWEYRGQVDFFIVGSKRSYDPNKDTGWSKWEMFPGEKATDNIIYGTTLSLRIDKKKGGDWELKQFSVIHPEIRPLSVEKVEELLKLPSKN